MRIFFIVALAFMAAIGTEAAPAAERGGDRAQQEQDCASDAIRLCDTEIPDEERVARCMMRHRSSLSAPCKVWFGQR